MIHLIFLCVCEEGMKFNSFVYGYIAVLVTFVGKKKPILFQEYIGSSESLEFLYEF